ncbi:MAG: SCO family protein, partial [Caldithrix sp.]|nr:SCO family protein [Caldithrix sp.]
MLIKRIVFSGLLLFILLINGNGQTVQENVDELQNIDVQEHLGDNIPLDLSFQNAVGDTVQLASYFGGEKPVVLVLAYYTCPMLCTLVLNGLTEVAGKADLDFGEDYRIVTVSIDPSETPDLALS